MFWSLTPREIRCHFEAAQKRLLRERDLAMFIAWHGAAFERSKKMPKLAEVLIDKPRRRQQTAEEAKAVMLQIFASRKGGGRPSRAADA